MGKELTPAPSPKDLGVTLDPNLTFDTHNLKNVLNILYVEPRSVGVKT